MSPHLPGHWHTPLRLGLVLVVGAAGWKEEAEEEEEEEEEAAPQRVRGALGHQVSATTAARP
jgi:hypothetical protein